MQCSLRKRQLTFFFSVITITVTVTILGSFVRWYLERQRQRQGRRA